MLRAAPRVPSPACRQRREQMVRAAEIREGARLLGAATDGFEPGPAPPLRPLLAPLARHIRRLEREHEARADPSIPQSEPPPVATEHDR